MNVSSMAAWSSKSIEALSKTIGDKRLWAQGDAAHHRSGTPKAKGRDTK